MKKAFKVVIEKDEDGIYVASVPELPGCHTQGDTLKEINSNIKENYYYEKSQQYFCNFHEIYSILIF